MTLDVEQIVSLIRPVKDLAGEAAWRAALARVGSPDDDREKLLTIPQAAGKVPWDERTIWRWIRGNKLPVYRTPGGAPRVKLCDFDAKLADLS